MLLAKLLEKPRWESKKGHKRNEEFLQNVGCDVIKMCSWDSKTLIEKKTPEPKKPQVGIHED